MKTTHRPTPALQRNVAALRLTAEKRSLRNPKVVPGNIPPSPPAKNPGPLTDSRRDTGALAADAFMAPPVTASSVNTFPVPDRIANAHLYIPPHMLPIHERGAAKAARAGESTPCAEQPRDTVPVPNVIPESLTVCNTLVGGNDHPLLDLELPGENLICLGPPTANSMLEEDNPVLEYDALEPTKNISLSAQVGSWSTPVIAPSAISQLDGNDEQVSIWCY
jgi:hypothetical protein